MNEIIRKIICTGSIFLLVLFAVCPAAVQSRDTQPIDLLNGRPLVLDSDGHILSWVDPDPSVAYPAIIDLSVEFLSKDLQLEHGYPLYYCRSCYFRVPPHDGLDWFSNPSDVLSGLIHSYAADYFGYTGYRMLLPEIIAFARYMIHEGSTPDNPEWAWPSVPYTQDMGGVLPPRNTDIGGAVAPHLIGKLGRYYIWLYKLTEDHEFLDAAVACADALACNIQPGTIYRSPWMYRVMPETGEAYLDSIYCADTIDPIALFDALIALEMDSNGDYKTARDLALTWFYSTDGPLTTDNWSNFFEDVGYVFTNDCQINIGETARYILEHPEMDPDWSLRVRTLIHKMETMFGEIQWGAWVMNEQKVYMYPMISHTARYASICALYYEKTGDALYKQKAFRAFNWSTYGSCPDKSRVLVEIMDSEYGWFTDCHGDYVQHIFSGMASCPDWAPKNENHLLRSSSFVQSIEYKEPCIAYKTFDPDSTEIFCLTREPVGVMAGTFPLPRCEETGIPGWTWQPMENGGVCTITHLFHREILISWSPGSTAEISLHMPAHIFSPGDPCRLDINVLNPSATVLSDYPLLVILDIYGEYWFGPSWGEDMDAFYFTYPPGTNQMNLIHDFRWPETGTTAEGILFWAGLTDIAHSRIICQPAVWEFGWEPNPSN
jgi:hypothetical protein